MPRDTSADHVRIKFKGGKPGDLGFEYFATIGARDLSDDEYDHELDDEQRAMIESRPDLYENLGPASEAQVSREVRRTERQAQAATRPRRTPADQAPTDPAAAAAQAEADASK